MGAGSSSAGTTCGDGELQAPEACDLGALNILDAAACTVPVGEMTATCCVACNREVTARGVGTIQGRVFRLFSSDGVAGAVVTVHGSTLSTTADAEGRFMISGVPADARVLLDVSGPRASGPVFSTTQLPLAVAQGVTSRALAHLVEGCGGNALDQGGTWAFDAGCGQPDLPVSVRVPADGLVDASGAAFTGALRVEASPLPVRMGPSAAPEALAAFPGDMSAVSADAQPVFLESFGALEVRLVDAATGAPLQLAQGRTATISFPAEGLPPGAQVPLWWFDVATGQWMEEGQGTVELNAAAQPVVTASVGHFTWWNADQVATRGCMCGRMVLPDGSPAAFLPLTATGEDYLGRSMAVSGADGRVCIPARAGSLVTLEAREPDPDAATQRVRAFRARGVPTPPTTASCEPGNELPLGDLLVRLDVEGTCVRGTLTRSGGAAAGNADVRIRTTTGTTTTVRADGAGAFCANIPPDRDVSLTALTLVGGVMERAQASAAVPPESVGQECGGACVDVGTVPMDRDTCVSGVVQGSQGEPLAGLLVEARGDALGFSTYATSDASGRYCLPVRPGVPFSAVITGRGTFGQFIRKEVLDLVAPAADAACGAPGCMDMGVVTVTRDACVSGRVLDEMGQPVGNARVTGWSPHLQRGANTTTAADGTFCIYGPQGFSLDLSVEQRRIGARLTAYRRGVNVPASELACGSPECGDAGILTAVTYAPRSCVRGRVLDAGAPYLGPLAPGVETDNFNEPLSSVRPGAGGTFCVDVPLAQRLYLRREDEPEEACSIISLQLPLMPPEGSCQDPSTPCVDVETLDFAAFCMGT